MENSQAKGHSFNPLKYFLVTFIPLLLPFAEVTYLRHITEIGFGFNLNNLLFVFGGYFFYAYFVYEKIKLKLNIPVLILNVALLGLYIFLAVNLHLIEWIPSFVLYYGIILYAVVIMMLAFFGSLDIGSVTKVLSEHKPQTVFFVILASSKQAIDYAMPFLWEMFSGITTLAVSWILHAWGEIVVMSEKFYLSHTAFTIYMAPSCSGLDGIYFFIIVASFIFMFDYEKYGLKTVVATYVLGILYMIFLNILRVSLFFKVGIWGSEKWGSDAAAEFVIACFHSHVGWLLYTLGVIFFFAFFFIFFRKKEA